MKRAPLLSKQHAQAPERGPRRAAGGLDKPAVYLLRCKYGSLVSIVRELWRRSSKVGAAPHPNAFLSQPDSTVRGGSTRGPSEGGQQGFSQWQQCSISCCGATAILPAIFGRIRLLDVLRTTNQKKKKMSWQRGARLLFVPCFISKRLAFIHLHSFMVMWNNKGSLLTAWVIWLSQEIMIAETYFNLNVYINRMPRLICLRVCLFVCLCGFFGGG